MLNWRVILGATLLVIGAMNLWSVYARKASSTLGVNSSYTRITCIVWIGAGALLLYRGLRKQE